MKYKNKRILITGGTGSFGSTATKYFLKQGAEEVRILSRDEKKQEELRFSLSDNRLKTFIGDVRDANSLTQVISDIDYVFHAAALKQVPSCEFFPLEAAKTNVFGTENVLQAAINAKVSSVVVLSTDKAVYPINAMGMSKALMEKVAIAKARLIGDTHTKINVTRYGNVMGSRGSVIPLFINQILNKKEVTITSGEMTRFLMSLSDSVNLVEHAFMSGENGELFVQKAPAATIFTLFEALSEMLNIKASYKVIGYRHGEKLYETLVSSEEMKEARVADEYITISKDERNLNYDKYISIGDETNHLPEAFHSHNANRLDKVGVMKLLEKNKVLDEFLK